MLRIVSLLVLTTTFAFGQTQPNASDVLEQALSGVVTVAVYQNSDVGSRPLGVRGGGVNVNQAYARALKLLGAKSSGSGFVVEHAGKKYVLTNAHVVESATDGGGSIGVYSINQKKYTMRLLGGDTLYDLAVLAFDSVPGPELTALPMRTIPARIGERVYAIGNPQGQYPYTVTDGIVSAKNRIREGLTGKFGFLQTTATVIWGNSGGPLVDEQGAVLGMNSQIAFGSTPGGSQVWMSQINFALEADIMQRLLTDVLTNDGLVRRAYLGLEFSESPDDDEPSPVLSAILPDSPVKTALMGHVGKRIRAVNGEEVRNVAEILGVLETVRPGGNVTLSFGEGQTPDTLTVRAAVLDPRQLETIARHALKSGKLTITDAQEGVTVSMVPEKSLDELVEEYRATKPPAKPKPGQKGARSARPVSPKPKPPVAVTYRLVAAGVESYRSTQLWRIGKLSHLGAVCRLMGLSGVLDLAAADLNDPDDVRFVRQWLSGEEDTIKSILWY